jgi:hypothetical protein
MAITRQILPINAPTQSVPLDLALSFAQGVTLTASGYASGAATSFASLGQVVNTSPAGPLASPGASAPRVQGNWVVDVSAASFASSNEFYQFFLLAGNDPNFANGNVDLIGAYDLAATAALRLQATTLGATPTPVPDTGLLASVFIIPFSNVRDQFQYAFVNLFVVVGGTSPSVTFSSWLSPWTGQKY